MVFYLPVFHLILGHNLIQIQLKGRSRSIMHYKSGNEITKSQTRYVHLSARVFVF